MGELLLKTKSLGEGFKKVVYFSRYTKTKEDDFLSFFTLNKITLVIQKS